MISEVRVRVIFETDGMVLAGEDRELGVWSGIGVKSERSLALISVLREIVRDIFGVENSIEQRVLLEELLRIRIIRSTDIIYEEEKYILYKLPLDCLILISRKIRELNIRSAAFSSLKGVPLTVHGIINNFIPRRRFCSLLVEKATNFLLESNRSCVSNGLVSDLKHLAAHELYPFPIEPREEETPAMHLLHYFIAQPICVDQRTER